MKFQLYTDGACSKNPGKGGYAFVAVQDDVIIGQGGGYEPYSTNQAMELRGVIAACEYCKALGCLEDFSEHIFTIHTDSAYIYNCVTQKWYVKWMSNGWKNSKKEPVANRELWEKLIPYFQSPSIVFCKVAGHAGVKYNEIVDQLAVSYRSEI